MSFVGRSGTLERLRKSYTSVHEGREATKLVFLLLRTPTSPSPLNIPDMRSAITVSIRSGKCRRESPAQQRPENLSFSRFSQHPAALLSGPQQSPAAKSRKIIGWKTSCSPPRLYSNNNSHTRVPVTLFSADAGTPVRAV